MGNISNVGEVADLLAAYLDEEAWIEFRAALLEALHDKVPPSADAIFRPKTTWARALTAFLGSRHVQPRSQALMMCQYVGLEQLPGMWRTAQAFAKKPAVTAVAWSSDLDFKSCVFASLFFVPCIPV